MAGAIIGEAALGAAFQALIGEFRGVIKRGFLFQGKLKKIRKKLEDLKPLIQETARRNVELDISNADFLKVMEEGRKLVAKLAQDVEKKRWWKFPWNTSKISDLDEALGNLMQELQAQDSVILRRILEALNKLLGEGSRLGSAEPVVWTGCCAAPQPPRFDVGLDVPLKELKGDVFREDRPVVVVTAPPGCGKTTLVQKLCKDDAIRARFNHNILFVKVSRKPNLRVIVEEIHQHYGRKVPDFRDDEGARNSLDRLLTDIGKSSPILLVLDDVWSESGTLIEKFRFQIPKYKILVTSRFEIPKFKPMYFLKMLSDDDAMALFRYHAKLEDRNDINAKEVVQRCKSCPLALQLLGSALCGQPRKIWRSQLEKWSTGASSILDFEKDLLSCLQSSLEVLGEKDDILKECFIDLGSFPEDRRIPASALIDIWTELYGIKEDVATDYLFNLNGMNMATVVVTRRDVEEDDDYYSEHFITLHDMLRELAIHQSKQNSGQIKRQIIELPGNNQADLANHSARLCSISTDGLISSEWCDAQLAETEVLILNFLKEDQVLPEFVQTMNQLKVLILTNYGFFPAELRNFQLLGHLISLKKIRLERVEIQSYASIKLNNLHKLSLFMCKVGQAFSSINIAEAFPNLGEINIDYCADLMKLPDGLCDIITMKKLSVTHCHKLSSLPEEIGKMINLETLRLRSCIDLAELPDSICELSKLNFLDISDCFSVRTLPEDIGKLGSLTKLNMKGCSRLQDLPPSVLDFEKLEEVVCDEEIKELWELYIPSDTNIELTLAQEDINLNFL